MQTFATHVIKIDVPVWDRTKLGNYIELGPLMRVTFIHDGATFAINKLAFGDVVEKVNEKIITDSFDCEDLLHQKGEIKIQIQRDVNSQPVPPSRAQAIALKRRPQFGYLLLNVGQGEKTKGQALGVVVAAKEKRIFVIQVVKSSVAEATLIAGDAILDINGTPVDPKVAKFVENIADLMKRVGQFTCVVERPIFDHVSRAIVDDITRRQIEQRPPMAADALEIGCRAAREFLRVGRQATPKSILINAKGADKKKDPERAKITHLVWKGEIFKDEEIGTSVEADATLNDVTKEKEPETSLKSIKRARQPFFEDFYDTL